MSQIDMVTFYGQLIATVVAFTTLHMFIGSLVIGVTHNFVAMWSMLPMVTNIDKDGYYGMCNNRYTHYSNICVALLSGGVNRVVDYMSDIGYKDMHSMLKDYVLMISQRYRVLGITIMRVLAVSIPKVRKSVKGGNVKVAKKRVKR
jgi:hypothetical protein